MLAEDLIAALTLLSLPRAGSASMARLLALAPSPREALGLPPSVLEGLGLHPETILAYAACRGRPSQEACRQYEDLQRHGIRLLMLRDAAYPPLLREIHRPPPMLFLQGSEAALHQPQVAVVGSRSPTPAGREFASELAGGLARFGLAVTSGLARGIDTAAHWGVLNEAGTAVAVMGTGPDRVYPAANRGLAERVLACGGALLTEHPPGVRPEPGHFPRRNRIISGLALGVVVVEAALPSGSLSTATHAAEQGREVMAVPGPVRSPTSRGCHELLRNGAALIETPEDVVRALGDRFRPAGLALPSRPPAQAGPVADLSPAQHRVLASTSTLPCDIDLLASRCGMSVSEVTAAVVQLELAGLVESTGAGVARLR